MGTEGASEIQHTMTKKPDVDPLAPISDPFNESLVQEGSGDGESPLEQHRKPDVDSIQDWPFNESLVQEGSGDGESQQHRKPDVDSIQDWPFNESLVQQDSGDGKPPLEQ